MLNRGLGWALFLTLLAIGSALGYWFLIRWLITTYGPITIILG